MFKQIAACAIMMMGMIGSCSIASANDVARDGAVTHNLSLQVSVDGNEVMAPVIEMSSATPAEVFIGSGDDDGYALVVDIVDEVDKATGSAGAHFVLWRGGAGRGTRLLDDVLLLGGNRRGHASEQSLKSGGAGQNATVTVVSHATYTRPKHELPARTACEGQEGSGAGSTGERVAGLAPC